MKKYGLWNCTFLLCVPLLLSVVRSQSQDDLDFSANGGLSLADFEHIALEYLRFNFEVASALTIGEERNSTEATDTARTEAVQDAAPEPAVDENESGLYVGSSAGSSFGIGQMLAIINEVNTTIPVATVAFDNALKQASDYLTEMYQLLLTTMNQDYDLFTRTQIFTNENITSNFLEDLNATVVPTSFDDPKIDVAAQINSEIRKLTKRSGLEQTYIPTGMTLPKSTRAMLVHTLLLNDKWELPWRRIGKKVFNNRTEVEMLEISGNFPYLESDRAIEVSIPVKADATRILSLILPRSLEDAITGELGTVENGTASIVRIQIPVFNFSFRVPHDGGVGSSRCDFDKQPNFLNVLDDVTYVSFAEEGLSAVSITSVQINSVEGYKRELTALGEDSTSKPSPVTSDEKSSSTKSSRKRRNSDAATPVEAKETLKGPEKLIVFDRPFTWTIIDDKVFSVPIFSGAVESFPGTVDLTSRLRPGKRNTVFGLDNTLRYLNCL